jgi:hypothetical protein
VDIPLAPEMLQLPFYEKGMGYGPFDEDTATTTKGYFKTFRHHRHAGEPISAEMISVFCDVLSCFATNLGDLLRRPPVEDKQVTHQSHIPRVPPPQHV